MSKEEPEEASPRPPRADEDEPASKDEGPTDEGSGDEASSEEASKDEGSNDEGEEETVAPAPRRARRRPARGASTRARPEPRTTTRQARGSNRWWLLGGVGTWFVVNLLSRREQPEDPESGTPAFALGFPRDPELDALVAAFEQGDYARVRKEAPLLAKSAKKSSVRKAATELRRRLDPDPTAVYLLVAAAVLLAFLAIWFWTHPHELPAP